MEADDILWQTKLAARLHDPAEKALVLLRDPAGHENGTSRALRRLLGLEAGDAAQIPGDDPAALANAAFPAGVPASIYRHVQRADWWAAAADRPQWPMEEISVQTRGGERTLRVARWAQVRWTNKPVLIHPLSGEQNDLGGSGGLADTDFHDIRARSLAHHERLLKAVGFPEPASADWRKALLALWRFAPELAEEQDNGKLGELWKLLPADTRVPDHSIWDHLDLTSAFAGAFAADPANEAALLTLSIGPVQPFIAAARKVEDLWAGSHLLARLSWEGMRVICDALGPDAILLPRLRSVPQVDLWLRDDCGLPEELFEHCDWQRSATDSNPLFGAALPNRFLAVVPASGAAELAAKIEHAVRGWLERLGEDTVARLLKAAEIEDDPALPCHAQMRDQLAGFPEVHWSVVPFSLVGVGNARKQTDLDTSALRKAMAPFFGTADEEPAGFLASSAWKVLHEKLELVDAEPADGEKGGTTSTFFEPNPGVLYPAIYELAERNLAAAKSLRPFEQLPQEGWRCTLSDETEWLTTDREELLLPPGQRTGTLWARIADRRPAWARKGEHLGALAAIKRLWPTIFASEVADALARDGVSRFVVSTHSMAIAHQLDQWLEHGAHGAPGLADLLEEHKHELGAAALPRRLVVRHAKAGRNALREAGMLPALLDLADESALSGAAGKPAISEQQAADIRRTVRETLSKGTAGETRLETYYGLLLMDGDRMGSWLANGHPGGDGSQAVSYGESFHPQLHAGLERHAQHHPRIAAYGREPRAISPGRHLAIAAGLNDFSLTVARHVIEQEHLGQLIYAGGDDVLAMLPVADLLGAMQRLRQAYSGHDPAHAGGHDRHRLVLHKGFALLDGRLMRMMGTRATASCGAVIAHHQAPLAAVRRELTTAEQRAKNEGGRDAFAITVIKRSGGTLYLSAKWGKPLDVLDELRCFLAHPEVSRRAAYHTLQWLDNRSLPQVEGDGRMLCSLLAYQFDRQARAAGKAAEAAGTQTTTDPRARVPGLAANLVTLALEQPADRRIGWLRNFLSVAEFLAREVRSMPQGDAR